MMSSRRVASALSFLLLAACSDHDEPAPSKTEPDISTTVYVGGTTDEALEPFIDATPKDDPRYYVIVDSPELGEPLPSNTPAELRYHLASEATHLPSRPPPVLAPEPRWKRPLRELLQLLGPPRVAYAHGTPYNGTAYFLLFRDADGAPQLSVFTGQGTYAPDDPAWKTLAAAKQPLSLEITSAFFEDNAIPLDGGPFVGGTFGLRIE